MSDAEPIVVLDPDDPAFHEPVNSGSTPAPDVLTLVLARSAATLATATTAQDYLRSVGITDPTIWAGFRLGAGDASLAADLDATAMAELDRLGLVHGRHGTLTLAKPIGINLPTFDPCDPERVVGVIRLTPAQNKHAFITLPTGVGCTTSITQATRVVLVDGPLTGLRLAQAGVPHVLLIEDPRTLSPLVEWLASREVVIAAHRRDRIDAIRSALGAIGTRAIIAAISPDLALSPQASLSILGITREAVRPVEIPPEITPKILHDLHTFACDRITAGAANEVLQTHKADDADLIRSYRMGYLPAAYHDALNAQAQRALTGLRLGRCLVLPATDEHGQIVDLFAIYAGTASRRGGCFAQVRGMLGAHVLGTHDRLIVTDNFPWLARLHRQGYRNVLLLRGPDDAVLNASRIAAAGVRSVVVRSYRHGAEISAAFSTVGISVTNETGLVTGDDWLSVPAAPELEVVPPVPAAPAQPSPSITIVETEAPALPPPPVPIPTVQHEQTPPVAERPAEVATNATVTLIEAKADDGVAICEVGPVRYAIELGDADQTMRNVVVRRGHASHQDRINLAAPAQCRRFATSAARRVEIDPERIIAHLAEAWRLVRSHEVQSDLPVAVPVAGVERTDAETLLRDPNLLKRVTADLSALGWVGEERAKGLLYLTAVSRLLPDPLWSVYRATTGAAPWRSLGVIASLMPPEACVVFHRLTESLLRRTDQHAFRHRLLLVDRAETLRPEGAIALRCLREWGSIGWKQVARAEGVNAGGPPGLVGDAIGPVAVLAAAGGDLDLRCRDCFLTVTVDESPGQTERVLADQRRQLGPGANQGVNAPAIMRRHHALQRLLRPAVVVIPFAERIAFPMTSLRHRDEHAAFLGLIQASALLHQFQRQRDASSAIIASESDFHHAVAVAGHLLGSSGDGLSEHGRHLMQRLFATKATEFVLSDLGGLITDWTYYTYRSCAEELVQMGYCTAAGGGQGRARRYTLTGRSGAVGIALLPVGSEVNRPEPFDLATAKQGGSQSASTITRVS